MADEFFTKKVCDRCGGSLAEGRIMSMLNEQTIYDGRGCNYRPDRIVWTADGHIDVVDFKFTSETSDEHRQQVRAYVSMLEQMGYEDVRGYLWYLLRNEVVQA